MLVELLLSAVQQLSVWSPVQQRRGCSRYQQPGAMLASALEGAPRFWQRVGPVFPTVGASARLLQQLPCFVLVL